MNETEIAVNELMESLGIKIKTTLVGECEGEGWSEGHRKFYVVMFPKTGVNQLKQEYISNRYLFYEGLTHVSKDFCDKDTSIIDDYNYNLHNIHIEKIKLSYRGFYSLFDKIAFFLNALLHF